MNKKPGCAAVAVLLCLFFASGATLAQTIETPRFEVGAQFSSLTLANRPSDTKPGFGGRFTVNLNDNVAVEAETNFYPTESTFPSEETGGRAVQGLFGVKAGKRFDKFGIFAKARPGLVHFTRVLRVNGFTNEIIDGQSFIIPHFRTQGVTHFAADLGGVVEFYPSRRIVTRFDIGDTIIRDSGYERPPFPGLVTFSNSATTHNFQFNAGIGFRF
ncbi:MAG TPA: outer membrane beta-barrel protein [Pyrinomonadaceae bacterium]|jgi:hypothetical protein